LKLWGGRFRKATAPELEQLGRSIDFDRRLARHDILVNRVYARSLCSVGKLTSKELETIERGLDQVEEQLASASLSPSLGSTDEDIHTAVERLLGEAIGPIASKLPAGRSRNDLAMTELRMYLASAIQDLIVQIRMIQKTLSERARESRDVILPGYTHMRRGQPVVFAQYLLAYFWALDRDVSRFEQARGRCLELPLGAGAIAGNPMGVDREAMARELGFATILENSIDAVSSRDFALEFLAAAAVLATHLSRMSEDLLLWSTSEFGFVELDEAYSTGSSLMPQKKNPDGLELIRGKCGRVIGDLTTLLTTVKGLPTGYQRDLQEDKEAVFDALDTLDLVLPVMNGTLTTLTICPDAMARALSPDLLATDLAEYLVEKGVPFRDSHRIVGEILALAAEKGLTPASLPLDVLHGYSPAFEEDVRQVWSYKRSVERKTSSGGVATLVLDEQLERARDKLNGLL
jgi:argininosuccinate lyase